MPERFDEKFKCIDDSCDGQGNIPHQVSEDEWEAQQCQFHAEYLFPLKDFIQSEIDLARREERERIQNAFIDSLNELDLSENLYPMAIVSWAKKDRENWIKNLITTK